MSAERVVVLTGAASGIGAATARRLAGEKTDLVMTTRANAEGLAETATAAKAQGSRVETLLGDLADPGFASRLVETARARFGRIDQLVSNAGRAQKNDFAALRRSDLADSLGVNTFPFVELVTACMEDLAASQWGRVISLSSFVANDFGINGTIFPATAASKAATEALTRALAFELARKDVTVNCVAPGYTRKVGGHAAIGADAWKAAAEATPNGRIAEPEDIAATIVFLLSREARHITGQVIRVDGGLSLL